MDRGQALSDDLRWLMWILRTLGPSHIARCASYLFLSLASSQLVVLAQLDISLLPLVAPSLHYCLSGRWPSPLSSSLSSVTSDLLSVPPILVLLCRAHFVRSSAHLL